MTMPPVLRKFAAALLPQNLRPLSIEARLCRSISKAVEEIAKASPNFKYTVDPAILQRVVGEYLKAHPTRKPLVLTVTELGDTCHVDYHEMCYGTNRKEQGKFEFIPQLGRRDLVDGKYTSASGNIYEGKWQYVEQLKCMCLKDGKLTSASGNIYEGKWQYVEQMNSMHLVDGKITYSSGKVVEGKRQFVEQLKCMCLVDGKSTFPSGEVHEGKWRYFEQSKTVRLVDGKITTPSGEIQEGRWRYVEQLKAVGLVDGKITGDQFVREGIYGYVEQMKSLGLLNGKIIFPCGKVEKGSFEYVEQLKNMYLVDGTITYFHGDVYSGTFAYVPGMDKNTQLVNGTLTYSTGRSETGEFAYIPQLNSMRLVNGTTKDYIGDVVYQGQHEYVPQINGMALLEGLSVFPDGTRQEGTRSYVPELNEVVLTAGSIIQGDDVQTGTWAYSQHKRCMVFTPPPPKPELPQHVCSQIQNSVQELVRIQRRFDPTGKYSNSAAKLNAAAQQALMAHDPEQYNMALQSFTAQYKTVTRGLSLLTHPDKVQNYSADIHGAALRKLADLRESIDGQVNRWSLVTVDWH